MNETTASNASEKLRTRRLTLIGGAMLLIGISVLGSLFWLQRRAMQSGKAQQLAAGLGPRQVPDITAGQKVEITDRAKWLREKWKPWALQHKAELTQMLRARPEDQAALMKVWNVLPNEPEKMGITFQELCPSNDPLVGVGFTWDPAGRGANTPQSTGSLKPEVREVMLAGNRQVAEWRQDRFAELRDVTIAQSMGAGQTHIQLWASGRITQQTRLPAKDRPQLLRKLRALGRPPRQSDLVGPYQEIVPPYDFLPSSKREEV